MALAPDRHQLWRTRRICFACVLLLQLAWIVPCSIFLLSQSSTPRMIILQDQSASRRINTQGFSGAVRVLDHHDIAVLGKLYEEWEVLLPRLEQSMSLKGFVTPPARTCFLWLPECFSFAKHQRILQIVKEAIGPRVLLYGVTIWKGRNEALQRFHRNTEVGDCEKLVNFVFGASVQLVSQSHKIPERLLQAVLRNLLSVEDQSLKFTNKYEELDFLERSFIARVKRMIRTPDVWLENLELDDDDGVFFHGGTLHRIGEALENRTGLLLQFISADCKVRQVQSLVWASQGTSHNLYLPPTVLASGDHMELGAINDVRLSMNREDDLLLNLVNKKQSVNSLMRKEKISSSNDVEPLLVDDLNVFTEGNGSLKWVKEGQWRVHKIGEASTSVMANGRIERLLLESTSSMEFGMMAGEGEQVIVVLSEELLYFRAVNDGDFQHYELLQLRPGSAVLLSKKVLQALVPLGSEAEMVSLDWVGHKMDRFPRNASNSGSADARMGGFDKSGHWGTQALEGRTITLNSGQAYDPDNDGYCDVIVFMVEGYLLQVLPSNITLQAFEVLLIPAHRSCVLWNVGGLPVKFFVMHLCRIEDDLQAMMSFGESGKVF